MKKIIALLLAAAMLTCLLAACGGTDATAQTGTSAPEAASAEAPAEEAEPAAEPAAPAEEAAPAEDAPPSEEAPSAEETAAEPALDFTPEEWTLPLSDGSDTLTIMACFPDPLFAEFSNGNKDLEIYKKAEEITGVNVDWTSLANSQAVDTFLLTIASGEYPDMFGWGLNYVGGNELAIEEGVYLDLTDIIKQYSPNYASYIFNDPDLLEAISTDSGYIDTYYALTLEGKAFADAGPQIRADILDELGMDKPYTIDELHEYLVACRDQYGMSEPLILPAAFGYFYNYFAGAFDIGGRVATIPEYDLPFYQIDGTIHFGVAEEGYKEYITLLNDWLSEGLISPSFIQENIRMLDTDEVTNKITTGQSGFWSSDLLNIDGYNNVSEIEGFRVEATYDIHRTKDSINHFAQLTYKGGAGGLHFSSQCSDTKLAAQWCDFWYTEEGSMLANYGVEGSGYTMVNGVPTYTDLIADNPNYNLANALLIYASNNTICCISDPERQEPIYSDIVMAANEIWHTGTDDAYKLPNKFALNAAENEAYSSVISDVATLCEENIASFITGERPMSEWDGFVDSLFAARLQEAIDIYQGALDRYLG